MAREYGTSVETTASPDKVWRVWSDMSTWGGWNPNVSTMDWDGGFVSGSTGVMNTKSGQHHKMQLVDVQPGRGFALLTGSCLARSSDSTAASSRRVARRRSARPSRWAVHLGR